MTKYTCIIPHYKTGQMTAFTIYQILKHTRGRDIKIVVVDNSNHEGLEYLEPFVGKIHILLYPKDLMQSHGIAYDFALNSGVVETEYFITLESDSYPTQDGWLDYYDRLVETGMDCAGSLLQLSGGQFIHPAGALYRKSVWEEAKKYTDSIQYGCFPNMAMKEGFPCHLMVRNDILKTFLENPQLYIDLHNSYLPYSVVNAVQKLMYYKPVTGVFHNGMGNSQESIATYSQRNILKEPERILLDNVDDLIYRVGFEPAQYFCYWALAMGYNVSAIPTEIKWLEGRNNQQQEFTRMENGLVHCWAITAYHKAESPERQDIIDFKAAQLQELYNSLPEDVKI
jgi:hypothetical protein